MKELSIERRKELKEAAPTRQVVGYKPIKINIRKCLKCECKFQSEGIHNRLCQDCRNYGGII
jgi:hypothetical protein